MDFVITVAGNIVAQFFEVAAFANLSLSMKPESATIEEQGRQIFPLGEQIGIDAKLAIEREGRAQGPEPDGRGCFAVSPIELVIAATAAAERPIELRPFRIRQRYVDDFVLRLNRRRQCEAELETSRVFAAVSELQFDFCGAIF